MKVKIVSILLCVCMYIILCCNLLIAEEKDKITEQLNPSNEIQLLKQEVSNLKNNFRNQENYLQKNEQLQKDISNFRDNFYDKTMQNVDIALKGANRATNLVSFFAILFTVLTVILAFFGFTEASRFKKIRLDAERNLGLASHFSLAYTYTQAFLYLDAIKEFLKVIEINNNNENAHTQLGYLYSALPQPKFSKSKLHSKRAVEINSQNYIAYLNLGVAMNSIGNKQEDVLSVYLKGEEIAIANLADDITIGKFKLFAGHCYKNLGKKEPAKIKYDEARPYFEKHKDSKILQFAALAKRWLDELGDSYTIVTKPEA